MLYLLHDCAPAVLLLEEAGGKVTDFEGKEFTENSKNVIASNGVIHESSLELIQNKLK